MKRRLIYITLFFIVVITGIILLFYWQDSTSDYEDSYRERLVDLNEIVQLSQQSDDHSMSKLDQAINAFKEKLSDHKDTDNKKRMIWLIYSLCVLYLLCVLIYVYRAILSPFDKLQKYADEIAAGNFEVELNYERTNYFGKFTWAFDHMRREITKARSCEKEAIENNKTVIATLSHDIKTPIASIRAYAEGLDANLDSGPEMRRKYSSVIMKKCDEVTKLTNDLFLHSLSDLDKLKISTTKVNIREQIIKIISDLQQSEDEVILSGNIPDLSLMIDEKRFEQVLENLINNAKKYAPGSKIVISSDITEGNYNIYLQDQGPGIPDEDMPFIFHKFYRGRNAGDNQGSGLGLYIVKYIMEQLGGSVTLTNNEIGLRITLKLPCTS